MKTQNRRMVLGVLLLLPQIVVAQEYDLFLCIGQSNMAGRGKLTKATMDTLSNVFLFNDRNEFEPAVNPLNKYSTIRKDLKAQGVGPAYNFAKTMSTRTGRQIGLVVNARGGSSIWSWKKGGKNGYYEDALRRVKAAIEKGGTLKAVLWHQGETDVSQLGFYKEQIVALVTNLRKDLGMPNLFFVAGEIASWASDECGVKNNETFNRLIRHIGDFIPNVAYVSSEGLHPLLDNRDPHFDTTSQLILGKRYAEKVLEYCYH